MTLSKFMPSGIGPLTDKIEWGFDLGIIKKDSIPSRHHRNRDV